MNILVFDTETTGLIPRTIDYNNKYWFSTFPYIVQFSWILYNDNSNYIIDKGDCIIKLKDDITIPEDSIKIHGITNERMLLEGIPIEEAFNHFEKALQKADVLVAHNLEFGKKVIIAELTRNNFENIIEKYNKPEYCTKINTVEYCAIKRVNMYNKPYLKWPRLIELHKKMFNKNPKNLHNSFNDVLITLRCYYKLKHNRDIKDDCDEINSYLQPLFT